MTPSRRRPRRTLPGLFIGVTLSAAMAVLAPLVPLASAGPVLAALPDAGAQGGGIDADTDVYIRDWGTPNLSDGDPGVEPHGNSVWTSPDIKVCHTSVECPVSLNPEVGQDNWIFVKLHSPGPGGSGADLGTLEVYRSTPGGGSAWPYDWTSIGADFNVSTAASGVTTVSILWPAANVPGPGHFCLLARWYSDDDPMTFAEPLGSNTVVNTQNNNNIAWRNVDSVDLYYGKPQKRPYAIGNPGRERIVTDLAFTDVRGGFTAAGGVLTIDLGQDVFRRWREGGGRAEGVKQIGETRFEITNIRAARFFGIVLDPRTRPVTQLEFSVKDGARKGAHVIRVNQLADLGQAGAGTTALSDVGGVEYRVTIR